MADERGNPESDGGESSERLADRVDDALQALWDGETGRLDALVESEESLETPGVSEVVGEMMRRAGEDTREAVVPDRIGDYAIKRILGRGGMGTVYLAVQEHPRRTVALKVLKAGIASRSALRRFEYEAQILARLRHPNIAQVYEAGTHKTDEDKDVPEAGVPYFAMEYVPNARPITDYAKHKKLSTRQRLELFAKVCDAIHHGHQKGIIHRDLKPGNILVDSNGEPKIIDFGVARSTDSDMAITTLQTDIGQLIGTLQYMSPEQCEADPHDLDVRSDVYALGVVLYELLCGQLPYDVTKCAVYEAARVIREETPARPSTLNRTLRGDIETIALKTLEKERDRRYRSAADLADDLGRYLRSEPIVARPPSVVYQVKLFARRHRAAFVAMSSVFVILAAATVVSLVFAVQANRARQQAQIALEDAGQARAKAEDAERQAKDHLSLVQQREQELRQALENVRTVVGFHEATFRTLKYKRAGSPIITELVHILASYREGLESSGAPPDKIEWIIDSFNDIVQQLDATALTKEIIAEDVLAPAVTAIETDLADQPLVQAALHHTIGETYWGLSLHSEAVLQLELALEIRRQMLGMNHAETLASADSLASVHFGMQNHEEALVYYRQAFDGYRHLLGDDHRVTAGTSSRITHILCILGRHEEALDYCLEDMNRCRRMYGDDHRTTVMSIEYVGSVLAELDRREEALARFQEAMEINRRMHGDEEGETLRSIRQVGTALNTLARYDEAEPYCRQALDYCQHEYGYTHVTTLEAIENLVRSLAGQRDFDTAESVAYDYRTMMFDGEYKIDLEEERVVNDMVADLYSKWHEAEPEKGYDAKAEEWRAKLPQTGEGQPPDRE